MNSKFKIASGAEESRLFSNLEPIVTYLIEHGNETEGFKLEKDGWICEFKRPIDFELVENNFEFPNNVTISKENNSILDHNTWVEIKGRI